MRYTVELESPDYSFRAKHFVAFPQEAGPDAPWIGELLHEHCFTASVKTSGPLDESDCVFDFVAARDALLEILAEFDGQTLVGTKTPCVEYEIEPLRDELKIAWKGLPAERVDVVSLSSARWIEGKNASAEKIAETILQEWIKRLRLSFPQEEYFFTLRLQEEPGSFAEVSI